MGMGMYGAGMHHQAFTPTQDTGKGKGKMLDADFEAAFAEFARSAEKQGSARIEEISESDEVEGLSSAMEGATLEHSKGEQSKTEDVLGDDFQKCALRCTPITSVRTDARCILFTAHSPRSFRVWEHLQMSDQPPQQEDMTRWEAEFNQLMTAQREDGETGFDYAESMQKAWESGFADGALGKEGVTSNMGLRFDDEGAPILGNYVFGE
jgi:peroxin-5